jgi:hypothetical protein
MLTGDITTLTPNFPAAGGPTLAVRGLNLFHRFRTRQITQAFFGRKDTEVAQALVDTIDQDIRKVTPRVKLRLDPDDVAANLRAESPLPFLVVSNQFPIVFLMERARRLGYDLTMDEAPRCGDREVTFHFRRSNRVRTTVHVLEWGKTLVSFQPSLRTADQVSKVTVRGWSPGEKKAIEKQATRASLGGEGVIDPADLGATEPSLTQEVTVDMPVANEAEAEQLAKNILRQRATELVTAKGKTVGLPDLRAGAKVQLKGLGARFSGTYLVTDTTHTMGESGYTTDFTARKEGGVG